MTHDDYNKNILNIKDNNIHFYENSLKIIKINGSDVKAFYAYLTYTPNHCSVCGCVNNGSKDIIKWNYKRKCKIKMPRICNYKTILFLDKQRFYCKNCKHTFIATTTVVDFHKQTSNDTILSIKLGLMKKESEKNISYNNDVSINTTNRILDSIADDKLTRFHSRLPSSFGIDEFNATKDTDSKMAFIIVNHYNNNVFDILNGRKDKTIETYFKRYQKFERNKVKFITMDLYKPYYILMHKLFKNAILIPDRFHIVIQFRNALDKTRISLCKKSNKDYRKLKKYWKLILKNEDELDDKKKRYSPCFRKEVTEQYIVSYLINSNDTLKATYNYYQGLLKSLNNRDKDKFVNIIHNLSPDVSEYAKKCNKTLLDMEKYIVNAFDYDLSNGVVEGTNNIIKQVKHNACGYKLFKHLRARILLIKGVYKILEEKRELIFSPL